ncbi:MAG: DUF3094 family protein [Gammaproteobacteria bacterium]|nr:DUF3094 family protein [Gammaproteobacteria bacterium]
MIEKPKLSEEDLARVREYLNSPIHQVERQPFRPLRLLLVLWIVVSPHQRFCAAVRLDDGSALIKSAPGRAEGALLMALSTKQ